jgi:lysophospholipase L1-like esterase
VSSSLRRGALVLALALIVLGSERLLKDHYYSRSYRYYEAGEVYWEDSHTLLLFSPDRYLFWRLKPNIRMRLEETPEQYGAYVIGTRKAPYAFEVRTGSHGYNSPEFDCAHKGSLFRIVTLGDSRTMAEGVPFDDLYGRRLEALLRARPGNRGYEVVNAGVSGYSSYQGLIELERELLSCAPDVVTVLFGINDQDLDQGISDVDKAARFDTPVTTLRAWSNRSMLVYFLRRQAWQLHGWLFGKTPARTLDYAGAGPRKARVPLEAYARNLERIAELGRSSGFRPVFLILPSSPYAYYPELFPDQAALPAEAAHALDSVEALVDQQPAAAETRLRALLQERPESSRARHLLARSLQRLGRFEEAHAVFVEMNRSIIFSRYEAIVRQVAAARAVTLVDLTPEFTALRREPLYLDDMHPNRLGHEIIARRLHEELVKASIVP